MSQPNTAWQRGIAGALGVGSFAIFGAVVVLSISGSPPLPLRWDDADWATTWLVLSILNYCLVAFSVFVIFALSEGRRGVVTATLCSILGATMWCGYALVRLSRTNTLALRRLSSDSDTKNVKYNVLPEQFFLAASGFTFFTVFMWTQVNYSLLSPNLSDPEWGATWLRTTVVDYSITATVLCMIIFWTEGKAKAAKWSALILLTGGIGCSAYVARRLWVGPAELELSPGPAALRAEQDRHEAAFRASKARTRWRLALARVITPRVQLSSPQQGVVDEEMASRREPLGEQSSSWMSDQVSSPQQVDQTSSWMSYPAGSWMSYPSFTKATEDTLELEDVAIGA